MYKKDQGITIVALVITIVIMLILVGVSIKIGTDVISRSQLEDIKTNMLAIQGKARIIKEKNDFGEEDLKGISLSEDSSYIVDENILPADKSGCYIWGEEILEEEGLSSIETTSEKFYIVDYNNDCEVYYSLGVKGKYSLTDLKDM